MKLLYGTTNPAKLNHMKALLKELPIEVVGITDLDIQLPKVDEDGATPLENARKKARAYYQATGMPVFSCDTGLYIEGLSVEQQPGVHARRKHQLNCENMSLTNVEDMSDEEMVAYYSAIAEKLGGEACAWYENAICLVLSEYECYEKQGGNLSSEKFKIVAKAHERREAGFPIDALSVELNSNKYYYDLPQNQDNLYNEDLGFERFFKNALAPLIIEPLSETMAKEVCKWRYDGLYSVYNLSDWEVVVSNCWGLACEDTRKENFLAISNNGLLIGFGRIQCHEEHVMLGIGLKPELCGAGFGAKSMSLLVKEAKKRHPDAEIGLEVRRFNERAKKCYESIGFKVIKRYKKETVEGYVDYEYMKLEQ